MIINEEGEPTNSVSSGSTDHHEPTDGKRCKKDDPDVLTRKGKKKKMSKYQEYKESLDYNATGWYEMSYDNLTLLKKNIINLNIPPTEYRTNNGIASFKNEGDMYNVQDLMDADGEDVYDEFEDEFEEIN